MTKNLQANQSNKNELVQKIKFFLDIKNYDAPQVESRKKSATLFLKKFKSREKVSIHSEVLIKFDEKYKIIGAEFWEKGVHASDTEEINIDSYAIISIYRISNDSSSEKYTKLDFEALVNQCALSALVRKNKEKLFSETANEGHNPYRLCDESDLYHENLIQFIDEGIDSIVKEAAHGKITEDMEDDSILPKIEFPNADHFDFKDENQRKIYFITRESLLAKEMLKKALKELSCVRLPNCGQIHSSLFDLSISIERILKLFLICKLEEAKNQNEENKIKIELGKKTHNLYELYNFSASFFVGQDDQIQRMSCAPGTTGRLLYILSNFAVSTRYFNLNNILDIDTSDDPIRSWIHAHYTFARSRLNKDRQNIIINKSKIICENNIFGKNDDRNIVAFDGVKRDIYSNVIIEETINESFDIIISGIFKILEPVMHSLDASLDYIFFNATIEYSIEIQPDQFEDVKFSEIWYEYLNSEDSLNVAVFE